MVKFVVTSADGVQAEFPITKEMVIGRNKENDIRVNEDKASRTHCKVKPEKGRVTLEDLGSSNGTRVNGHRIKALYVLRDGDTIKIGKTKIVFQDEEKHLDRTMELPAVDDEDEDDEEIVLPDEPAPASPNTIRIEKKKRADTPETLEKVEKAEKPAKSARLEKSTESKRRAASPAAVAEEPRVSKRKAAVAAEPEPEHDEEAHEDAHDEQHEEDHEEHEDGEVETEANKTARLRREAAEQRQFNKMIGTGIRIAALVIFIITVYAVVSYERDWKLAHKVGLVSPGDSSKNPTDMPPPLPGTQTSDPGPAVLPPIAPANTQQTNTQQTNIPPTPPSLPPDVPTVPATQTQTTPKTPDPAVQDLLTKALADRDKALAAGNYPGARSGIQSFAAAHPEGEVGKKARQEWKDTLALIDAALQPILDGAKRAASDKKYNVATQRCTRLIAADPSGKYGQQAREILSNIDIETEPKFSEYQTQAQSEMHAGKLREAADTLGRALDELGGTKWAAVIASMQLEAIMADTLLEKMEAVRQKRADSGKEPVFNMVSKKLEGVLAKVRGVTLDLKMSSGVLMVSLKNIDPTDFAKLLDSLDLGGRHLDQAYLWLALDRKDAARKELDAALQDPGQATAAAAIAGSVFEMRNLHAWDFSKWQHQSDWDALSGSWSIQNGKYVQESPEGGDTALRADAVGGPILGKNLRIGFDFELTAPQNNFLFAVEFGPDEQHAVSAIFNAGGLTLHSNIGDAANVQDKAWKPAATHVDVAIQGDTLNVTVGGKTQTLQVAGLSALKGTLTFRTREAACALSHVIVRTAD